MTRDALASDMAEIPATAQDRDPSDGPVAYPTGFFPMAPHTFIRREIAAFWTLGERILIVSVRDRDPST